MSTFYITTPAYYVNDVPHLGHAYTTIVCDTIARYHRMRGDDTRFLTGTDEHGQKVEEAATKRGLTPKQLVDQVAPRFDELWQTLGLEGYRFIRTTSPRHQAVVKTLWERIRKHNPTDLFLDAYQGWYCVGCEAFYTESQLEKTGESWSCTTHKRPVQWVDKERSWFFRLSKYAEPLLKHIEANPDFIRPDQYRKEIVSFLQGGLKDLSVSRTSFSWGIPVPEEDSEGSKHVIYVWMDALTNYLSDLCPESGEITGPDVEKYWPHAIHMIGKDILRFHSVYWPAFLLAANLPLPQGIFAHGWWTVRGEKISKSMPATRIDPLVLSDALGAGSAQGRAIGVDAMRYYLLREIPLGNDGDFTFESLFGRFNAELANDLGNLINRSLTLITKFAETAPPRRDPGLGDGSHESPHFQLEAAATEACRVTAQLFDSIAPSRALEQIWKLVGFANRYIDQTAPWALAKANDPALPHVLWSLQSTLWVLARLVAPVLPATAHALRDWLGDTGELRWPSLDGSALEQAPESLLAKVPSPLFPRLDEAAQQRIVDKVVGDAAAPAGGTSAAATKPVVNTAPKSAKVESPKVSAGPIEPITFDQFGKVDLRVGTIVTASAIPKAKKLLHLAVDLGEDKPRSVVAGIAEAYAPEALVGKQVIVVANLVPAEIRGIRSEGMILAVGGDVIIGLSAVDRDVPPGTKVH